MKIKSQISNKIPVSPSIDKVGVEERVARFQSRSIKKAAKKQGLNMVLSMIDLTT
ncbi:MAG: deoxyribose-phosphate aldolase, partial [Crocinitomicaceae bacterium]|nr:deoxyribose-phosphate aldolase [Crocinitomicaceae bacterium]